MQRQQSEVCLLQGQIVLAVSQPYPLQPQPLASQQEPFTQVQPSRFA